MQLVDQGRIALRDRVQRFVPEFRGGGKDELTLFDLCTHTSGLVDTPMYDARRPMRNKTRDVWGAICSAKTVAPAGTAYRYQDINFIALGKLLEAVIGSPLDRAFAERIAAPLGLTDTRYLPPESQLGRIAATARVNGEMLVGRVHDPRARALGGVAGNAGLFGTAREVWRIAEAVLGDGKDHVQLLSPAAARAMTRVQTAQGLTARCIGWDADETGSGPRGDLFSLDGFGHTGFTGTSVWVDRPTATVVVLLTNRLHPDGGGDVTILRRRVANVVAAGQSAACGDRTGTGIGGQ
jgi:CubicO group peptidase (beta-lactamase class C family)